MQEELPHDDAVARQVSLEAADVLKPLLPDVLGDQRRRELLLRQKLRMHAHHERFLVVAAVEDADVAAVGQALSCSARDSRGRGPRADGALKEKTWQPCGLMPDMTCLMAPSLPAASMAWKMSSTAHVLA